MAYKDLDKNLRTRFRAVVPADRWDDFMKGIESRKPQTFRINRLKTDAEATEAACRETGIVVERVSDIPDAYRLADPHDIARLRELEPYEDGAWYSQGLSSQIPALCMDLAPGLRVLDATAAPGSKTSQIASLMGDTGRIDACESAGIRYQKLLHTVRTQGCASVTPHHADVREWLASLPAEERYDRILLDPACSAMGRIWTEHEKTYAFWSSDLPARHARTQSALLDACLARLAPGGTLVYSTCTLSTEENEWVVTYGLKRHKDCSIEPIAWTDALPESMPSLREMGAFVFCEGIENARRFLPSVRMEGFFVAKIRKGA